MNILGSLIAGMLLLTDTASTQVPSPPVPAASAAEHSADEHVHFGWADVLRVDPVYDEDAPGAPQQECYEEQVPAGSATHDADNGKRTVATVFGAIIGGLLGNRIGNGNGRTAATAAGAVAGGVVGNNLAARSDNRNEPEYTTQRHCRPAGGKAGARRVVAYDVEYRYRGGVYTSRLSGDPGDRLRVRVSVEPAP